MDIKSCIIGSLGTALLFVLLGFNTADDASVGEDKVFMGVVGKSDYRPNTMYGIPNGHDSDIRGYYEVALLYRYGIAINDITGLPYSDRHYDYGIELVTVDSPRGEF